MVPFWYQNWKLNQVLVLSIVLWIETLEVLSDQSLVEELLAARLEQAIPMTKAEMLEFLKASRA